MEGRTRGEKGNEESRDGGKERETMRKIGREGRRDENRLGG